MANNRKKNIHKGIRTLIWVITFFITLSVAYGLAPIEVVTAKKVIQNSYSKILRYIILEDLENGNYRVIAKWGEFVGFFLFFSLWQRKPILQKIS